MKSNFISRRSFIKAGALLVPSWYISKGASPIIQTPARGVVASASPFLTNLVGHWKFNESSGNPVDSSTFGTTLTNNNTATFSAGLLSNAINLAAASTQYASAATNANISTAGDISFSFQSWAKFTSLAATRPIVQLTWDESYGQFILFYNAGNNDWRVQMANGATQVIEGTTTPSTGNWFHFVFTYNASTDALNLYVNGGTPATASYAGGNTTNTGNFKVGALTGSSLYMDGQIDDTAIWTNRVISSGEVATLYNGGVGLNF